jgi:hypothetical protein
MSFEYPKPTHWYVSIFQSFDRYMMHLLCYKYNGILLPLSFCLSFIVILTIFSGILRPSRKWRAEHHILGMKAGNLIDLFLDWILIPILDKIVFLFTSTIYKAKVLESVKVEENEQHKKIVSDYRRQVQLITEDRNTWRKAYETEKCNTEKSYWDGAKHGYSLGEKQKSKRKNKDTILTESQFFTLQQIANGNKTVGGLAGAYLEDHGYVNIVWDDKEHKTHHYKITKKGSNYLHGNRG